MQVSQHRHLLHLGWELRLVLIHRVVVVGDAEVPVGLDQGLVQHLLLLVGHVGDEQAEKRHELLDFPGQQGIHLPVADLIDELHLRGGHMADLHDVDAVRRAGCDLDELPADVVAGPAELVALDGRHNKALDAAHPHPQGQQLHGKGLPRPGGAQEHQVGVLVHLGVEEVHNAQGIVPPVHPQQHPVVVGHLVTAKGIGRGRPTGEDVSTGFLLQAWVALQKGQHRAQGSLLLEVALTHLHIHGLEHVRHLPFSPQQFLIGLGGHGDEDT